MQQDQRIPSAVGLVIHFEAVYDSVTARGIRVCFDTVCCSRRVGVVVGRTRLALIKLEARRTSSDERICSERHGEQSLVHFLCRFISEEEFKADSSVVQTCTARPRLHQSPLSPFVGTSRTRAHVLRKTNGSTWFGGNPTIRTGESAHGIEAPFPEGRQSGVRVSDVRSCTRLRQGERSGAND